MTHRHLRPRRTHARAVSLVGFVVLCLIAVSCGGTTNDDADAGRPGAAAKDGCLEASCGESGLDEAGEPQRGGTLVYGLEDESSGGFCLPEAQLAISGELVVRAIYDTLTVPNAAGGYSPYLAESVTPNDDFTTWSIVVRDGVTFHDGTDLTGEVVKNNLDAYRGTYPTRKPLLFLFTLSNIEDVTAEGQTVTVTTKVPWVGFPAFLFSGSRMGIMAQAQLDDEATCDREPIGTGPFVFESWSPNDKLIATANADYWQTAPDGKPYPYADGIEFRVLPDNDVRATSLESDDGANIIHTANAESIGGRLQELRDAGDANLMVSDVAGEVTFIQMNATKPPFDDARMRKAFAMGLDRDDLNEAENDGWPTIANGAFAPGSDLYEQDPGFPAYDPAGARALIADYVADGGEPSFTLTTNPDPGSMRFAERIQQRAAKVGLEISLVLRDQAASIDDAIGKKYQSMVFRNFPGGDPDTNYVWWYGEDNPVNFSGYDDPEVNRLLDEGRSETDPVKRTAIYRQIDEVFAKEVHYLWTWYTPWAVATDPGVHGILGPPLPGEDPEQPGAASTDDREHQPSQGLANGHSLLGLWIEQ